MKETTAIKYKSKIPMKAHCMCVFFPCAVQGLYKKSRGLLGLQNVKGYDVANGGLEFYAAQNTIPEHCYWSIAIEAFQPNSIPTCLHAIPIDLSEQTR